MEGTPWTGAALVRIGSHDTNPSASATAEATMQELQSALPGAGSGMTPTPSVMSMLRRPALLDLHMAAMGYPKLDTAQTAWLIGQMEQPGKSPSAAIVRRMAAAAAQFSKKQQMPPSAARAPSVTTSK